MVAMPRWTDQSTNAKYITDVLYVGLRGKGIVTKEEIEMCIKESERVGMRLEGIHISGRNWPK